MKQIGSIKKTENLMRNLTILLTDNLQKCWLFSHTFMANSPLLGIGDRVALHGIRITKEISWGGGAIRNHYRKEAQSAICRTL
jgi:hypothetical protein